MLNCPLETTKGQIRGSSLLQICHYDGFEQCAKIHALDPYKEAPFRGNFRLLIMHAYTYQKF